jgi:hypothetical protein
MIRAASAEHRRARGWGETRMALRVSSAMMILKKIVQTGLVEGVSAKMIPAGLGNSTILSAGRMRFEQ